MTGSQLDGTASRYRWVILFLAFGGQLSSSLAGLAVAPLAPLFQPELGLTRTEVGLFSSAVYAGAWGVLLVAGSITDGFGVRRVMALGQVLVGLLLLSMSAVSSFPQAVAVMLGAGVGRGIMSPAMAKAVTVWFPPASRATAMGLKQTGFPLGGLITASVLPAVGLALGWRSAIALVGFVVLAFAVATATLYRDPAHSGPPRERTNPWAGLGDVIRNRRLWLQAVMAVLLLLVQLGLATYLALYLVEVVLVSAVPDQRSRIVAAGGFLAFCQVGGVLSRVCWGAVSDRIFHGRRLVVLVIIAGISALMSVMTGYFGPGTPLWLVAFVVFLYGASAIGWNGLYDALVTETVGHKSAGTGLGLAMTLSQIGTVGGAPLFGFVVDASGSYRVAWLLLGILSAGAAFVGILAAKGESANHNN